LIESCKGIPSIHQNDSKIFDKLVIKNYRETWIEVQLNYLLCH